MNLLFLSDTSNPSQDIKDKIIEITDEFGKKIVYVSSSFQDSDRQWFHNTWNEYKVIVPDIELKYLDLSDKFTDSDLKNVLNEKIVHLSGGNTFFFLYHMKKRGFDSLLKQFASKRRKALIGVSAGAIIMTPTIQICDFDKLDTNEVGLKDLSALNLVDFEFYPHYEGTEEEDRYLHKYSKQNKVKVYVCSDQDGISVENKNLQKLGNPKLVK